MLSYAKAPEVDDDLESIVEYTAEMWGVAQVRSYMAGLEQRMEELAFGAAHYKSLDQVCPNLRVTKYEHHYIFGIANDSTPMLIIAVFHERMNIVARLNKRLI